MFKRIALILTATVIALSSFTFPSRAVAPIIAQIAKAAAYVVGGSGVMWGLTGMTDYLSNPSDIQRYFDEQETLAYNIQVWWSNNATNIYDIVGEKQIIIKNNCSFPSDSHKKYCENMLIIMNIITGYDERSEVLASLQIQNDYNMGKTDMDYLTYCKLKEIAMNIDIDIFKESGVTFDYYANDHSLENYLNGRNATTVTVTVDKPKTLSLFGLDYEVMNTDKKYSHSYKEEPTIYKIVDGLHNRAYELILVDEDNNIYVQLNQELFNLYSSGFRNYYKKEGSFYGKGYLTNLSRIDQNGNHVYQNLQMIDSDYGHQRVSFYSSQNDNFTYYYFNDITGKFSMYLRSETKEDYVRIEFENLYYNINNSLHEEIYYTHDDIKNKKLTPYIIKNVSNLPTATIAENILMYREVDSNINIGDDVVNFKIPASELEQTINGGLITGVIKNENPSITITDTGVTTVDGINYDELVKAVEKAITETKATEESKDKDTKRNLDIDMPDVIIDKFPFSIPFDLYNAFTVLVEEPKAPVISIPLFNQEEGDYKINNQWYDKNGNVKMFYIDYTLVIDLSEYELIAIIFRSFIYIVFCIGLIMATNKLIGR